MSGPLDAVVVLGCRVGPGGAPGEALARRVRRAARAVREGEAALVLASGGRRWAGVAEAWAMRRALVALGVAEGQIHVELCSLDTRENARYSALMLQRLGLRRVGLVSCDWHLPRALRLFSEAGCEVVPLPAVSPPAPPWVRVYRSGREWIASLR